MNWRMEKMLPFSLDCSRQLYKAGTTLAYALQLAVYGGKEIYLLGVKFSYAVEIYENGSVKRNDVNDYTEILENKEEREVFACPELMSLDYQTAKKYADTHGIKIYNATRGGKLEVFPRVDFDSLFD